MKSLDWKDIPEKDTSSKQSVPSFKASTATPWFPATVLLVGIIGGFAVGSFTN